VKVIEVLVAGRIFASDEYKPVYVGPSVTGVNILVIGRQ
jgi:hypothetical protein